MKTKTPLPFVCFTVTLLSMALLNASLLVMPAQARVFDLETKLTPSDSFQNEGFGASLAISGNTAIIGAPPNVINGSAYLFDITTGDQIAKLIASDVNRGTIIGESVAISGNMALVGATGNDVFPGDFGSAHLFDVTTGSQIAKFTSGIDTDDWFGWSVAISGDTVLVGAWGDDDAGNGAGAAYLFDITTGNQIAKLNAADAAASDNFGWSVAISGNTALVGASGNGSAYLFDITTGNQIAKLTASNAAAEYSFGSSVAIYGNIALVGAPRDSDATNNAGAAYLFDITTGTQIAKLTASDAAADDSFGSSVSISGNTALVGARGDYGSQSGSAYLFDVTAGNQIAKLTAATGDFFLGSSVAISDDTALIGAWGNGSGSVYLLKNSVPEPTSFLLATLAGLFTLGNAPCRTRKWS